MPRPDQRQYPTQNFQHITKKSLDISQMRFLHVQKKIPNIPGSKTFQVPVFFTSGRLTRFPFFELIGYNPE
jgi:hypothetical protein